MKYIQGQRQIGRDVDAFPRALGRAARGNTPTTGWGAGCEGVVHYVALGDSAAQGVGASHWARATWRCSGAGSRWRRGGRSRSRTSRVSGAISGDVVAGQLPALAELGFEPDIVTLDIGGNDVVFAIGNTVESFAASFDKILAGLPAGSFVGDVPWFVIPGLEQRSRAMASRAVELIERHGHHKVPIYGAMRQEGRLLYYTKTAADWFHPNDKGHQEWADLFWMQIEASGRIAEAPRAPGPRAPRRP